MQLPLFLQTTKYSAKYNRGGKGEEKVVKSRFGNNYFCWRF